MQYKLSFTTWQNKQNAAQFRGQAAYLDPKKAILVNEELTCKTGIVNRPLDVYIQKILTTVYTNLRMQYKSYVGLFLLLMPIIIAPTKSAELWMFLFWCTSQI